MDAGILVIASRFNELIVKQLLSGALEELQTHGFKQVRVCWVPGSFEIPGLAATAARSKKYSAIIALGAVIRGETPHFDYISSAVSQGLMQVSLTVDIPVIFGILTTDTADQALMRCGIKGPNKGAEAAKCAIDMLSVKKDLGL